MVSSPFASGDNVVNFQIQHVKPVLAALAAAVLLKVQPGLPDAVDWQPAAPFRLGDIVNPIDIMGILVIRQLRPSSLPVQGQQKHFV